VYWKERSEGRALCDSESTIQEFCQSRALDAAALCAKRSCISWKLVIPRGLGTPPVWVIDHRQYFEKDGGRYSEKFFCERDKAELNSKNSTRNSSLT